MDMPDKTSSPSPFSLHKEKGNINPLPAEGEGGRRPGEGRTIGIVVATRFEASPIFNQARFKQLDSGFHQAQVNGTTVLVSISGVGMERARKASYDLCDAGAKELVSAGYCGSLSKDLNVGDLVTDRIATSHKPVWAASERLALADRAGAKAVDMETQAIIEAGTRRGVPIRILRVVSDSLGDDVSPLLGDSPNFSVIRILLRLWNPTRWPYLYKMWHQSRIASRRLGQAVAEYLQEHS